MRRIGLTLACLLTPLLVSDCHSNHTPETGRLLQRGYLWQRNWPPAVAEALQQADRRIDGVVVLGAEILWDGNKPQIVEANISWPALQQSKKPCALALRIAPYPGPFSGNDEPIRAIAGVAQSLLAEAQSHGVTLDEFQIDFDCAQDKLAGYREWLHILATVVRPTRLVITTLPAWLDESGFPALVREADGYVLQVHSVPTLAESGHASLCDPVLARKWVAKAAHLQLPFSVALPTYWCLAGYNPAGKLIGVAMDSVQPAWPPGTRVLEFTTNADDIARLVKEWQSSRPAGMQGMLWYRLPVATDLRNWRWPTLLAVMSGRSPAHRLQVAQEGEAPVDFSVINAGEADESLDCSVVIRWNDSSIVALDALPGWTVAQQSGKVTFTTNPNFQLRLSPGAKVGIGWIRFEKKPALQAEIAPQSQRPL